MYLNHLMGAPYHAGYWGSPTYMCIHAQLLLLCLTLWDPMDCSPLGSSVHVILQARLLEWIAMPSSRVSSQPRDWPWVSRGSCIAGRFFTTESPGCKGSKQKRCAVHPTLQVRWPVPLLASPGWFQGYMQQWSHPDWMVHLIPTSDGWCQANRPWCFL